MATPTWDEPHPNDPTNRLIAAAPYVVDLNPVAVELIAHSQPLDPREPEAVWAAATVNRWQVPHDLAWWLTCAHSWPCDAVTVMAMAGGTPDIPVITRFDEARDRLDTETRAQIQQVLDDELAALLARLGVRVMAAVKDPALKAALAPIPIEDVWHAAKTTRLTGGKTVTAAVGPEEQTEIDKILERAERRIRRILGRAEDRANGLADDVVNGDPAPERTSRITAAITVLRERLAAAARRILDPRGDRTPDTETPDRTGASGAAPPAITRDILNAAGGADVTPDGRISVDDDGRPLTGGRPGPTGHAVSTVHDENLNRRLTAIGRNLRTADDARDAIGEHGRDITALARAITRQRLELVDRLVWRRGNPPNPFDPHVQLEGVVHRSADHNRLSTTAFEQPRAEGGSVRVQPWGRRADNTRVGRWFPGDHDGCQCFWQTQRVPTLVPATEPPTRTAEEAIIDELLGASL